ncbi:DNA recombination protein RmuC [Cellulomonas sp. DKR-3]|uniref:DNA recombination protein RmuC n=1 Tax=Cellulomonas fulva TaxID=2835530 RepID=A0ABS5TUN1_9CELL|nr:DNA recombination protein RmuC [Cellulomonas fulva]MBT0992827.1 DNA recombination protein RmuC [Cellulomonas fulva]
MDGQMLLGLVVGLALGGAVGAAVAWAVAARRAEAQVGAAHVAAAQATARLESERAAAADRLAAALGDGERLAEQFRALAADALSQSSEQFLALASQRFAADRQTQVGELAQREQAVRALVEPLTRTLDEVRGQLTAVQRSRAESDAALREQVEAMRTVSEGVRTETAQLATALRASQVRGRWGEMQLRRVVEAAGMLAHVDFVEQEQVRTDDGLQRPDMVVRLAGGKQVVVDAKVAFLGYLDAVQASDERTRAERLAAHARHVRTHVDQLAAKRYWDQFAPAPEFVVMFVPAEAFLHAALEQDASLWEYAAERNVIVATPTTLLALLRTVAYGWRQDALAANAQAVLDLGKQLHGRLATLGGHLARLGRSLDGAAQAYNQTVGSLETRVLVSARRFADLGVVDAPLETPAAANPQLSAISAPELLASAADQLVSLEGFDTSAERDARALDAEVTRSAGAATPQPGGSAPGAVAGA